MTTTTIEFTKVDSDYVCELTDYNAKNGEVSLALSEPNQIVSVLAGPQGMPAMVVQTLQTPYGLGLMFEIDFPEGIGVTLRTSKPVISGVWLH